MRRHGSRAEALLRRTHLGGMPVEDGEQELEDEPSLGSVDAENQERWAQGRADETEQACDDEGAHDDRELSPWMDDRWLPRRLQ